MSKPKIPDAVLAQLHLNVSTTNARLVEVRDELDRTIVSADRYRVLWARRAQLEEQHAAWMWLVWQALHGPEEGETR